MFAIYQQAEGAWTRLAPGQTSLMPLVEELTGLMVRDTNSDVTLVPFDLAKVKGLFADGDAALPDTDILLPEGTPDPDRWVWAFRDHRGERVGERFHRRTLPEQISDWFWYRSNSPFGTKEPDWRLVEKFWHPSGDVLLIRPAWSARALWPTCFPEPPKLPEEFERRAAEHREKTLARRKTKLARERAEQNAKESSRIDTAHREAVHAISRKFD